MQYYLTGLAVNEMTSSDWSEVVPGTDQSIGSLALQSRWVAAVELHGTAARSASARSGL